MKTQPKKNLNGEQSSSPWMKQDKPMIIAGPCAAETPEQMLDAAHSLAADGRTDYFRAGIWKPRTSPGSFQGIGVPGLEWMNEVKKETGLKVTTEVGSEKHVEEALKAGIDMLWIGARTVSNPFIIQEIADSLRGVDIPILVKNPLSPDLDLWEGAIKRLSQSGVKKLGAIHRGFFWWGKSQFRNQPFWHIPLELRKRMPEMPVIVDPSHMAGRRTLISLLAQRALEHEFSGLMIEVHPNPEEAWSDAAQQITPESFSIMLNELLGIAVSNDHTAVLEELRSEIDTMDDLLVWALTSRMELSAKIAALKKSANMEALQSKRWQDVLNRVKTLGENSGLRAGFIEKLFNSIHDESLAFQIALMKSDELKIEKEHNFVL
jgi:chorismate mutase